MSRLKTIGSESLRSLGANMSTTLAATVTVLIGMFLLGLFIALWSWAHSYDRQLKDQLSVRVYFCTQATCGADATKKQETAAAARLNGDSRIRNVQFVSKEKAFRIMLKKQPDAMKALPANPLPDALKISPKSGDLTPVIGKAVVLPSLLHGPLNAGSDVKALGFELNALAIIGVGLALGAAGSGLTIRRFLKI